MGTDRAPMDRAPPPRRPAALHSRSRLGRTALRRLDIVGAPGSQAADGHGLASVPHWSRKHRGASADSTGQLGMPLPSGRDQRHAGQASRRPRTRKAVCVHGRARTSHPAGSVANPTRSDASQGTDSQGIPRRDRRVPGRRRATSESHRRSGPLFPLGVRRRRLRGVDRRGLRPRHGRRSGGPPRNEHRSRKRPGPRKRRIAPGSPCGTCWTTPSSTLQPSLPPSDYATAARRTVPCQSSSPIADRACRPPNVSGYSSRSSGSTRPERSRTIQADLAWVSQSPGPSSVVSVAISSAAGARTATRERNSYST